MTVSEVRQRRLRRSITIERSRFSSRCRTSRTGRWTRRRRRTGSPRTSWWSSRRRPTWESLATWLEVRADITHPLEHRGPRGSRRQARVTARPLLRRSAGPPMLHAPPGRSRTSWRCRRPTRQHTVVPVSASPDAEQVTRSTRRIEGASRDLRRRGGLTVRSRWRGSPPSASSPPPIDIGLFLVLRRNGWPAVAADLPALVVRGGRVVVAAPRGDVPRRPLPALDALRQAFGVGGVSRARSTWSCRPLLSLTRRPRRSFAARRASSRPSGAGRRRCGRRSTDACFPARGAP